MEYSPFVYFWDLFGPWPFGADLWMTPYMVNSAVRLLLLREQLFWHFNLARWQSVLTISLKCALVGLHPSLRASPPDVPMSPLWFAVATSLVMAWLTFLVIVTVLRWWMMHGGRWDGQGDLFNLVAAVWLVSDALGEGLVAIGAPVPMRSWA